MVRHGAKNSGALVGVIPAARTSNISIGTLGHWLVMTEVLHLVHRRDAWVD